MKTKKPETRPVAELVIRLIEETQRRHQQELAAVLQAAATDMRFGRDEHWELDLTKRQWVRRDVPGGK